MCTTVSDFLSKNYPPPNESPNPQNAIRLVRQWLVLSPLGRSLLQDGISDSLRVEQISGGITNILYRITVANTRGPWTHCNVTNNFDEQVLCFLRHGVGVRFFGCTKGDIVDRKREAATLDYLSRQGLCKRVFYRFEGGQIDEWRVGRCITVTEMKDPNISRAVAVQLAALHRLRLPAGSAYVETSTNNSNNKKNQISRHTSQTWPQIWKWWSILDHAKSNGTAPEILDAFDFKGYRLMGQRIQEHNAQFQSPLVMCHNDLLNGNIVKVEEETGRMACEHQPRIEFIDFEYAGVGERGFDIANHFCEMAGFECKYELLPTTEFQEDFLTTYLESLETDSSEDETRIPASSEESSDHSSSPELLRRRPKCSSKIEGRALLPEILSYMLTSHFFWGLWALVQTLQWHGVANAPCDYVDYAHRRLNQLTSMVQDFISPATMFSTTSSSSSSSGTHI